MRGAFIALYKERYQSRSNVLSEIDDEQLGAYRLRKFPVWRIDEEWERDLSKLGAMCRMS